jgi:hypothetical protein
MLLTYLHLLLKKRVKTPINGIYVSKSNLCSNPKHIIKLNNAATKFVEEYNNGRLSSFEKSSLMDR